MALANPSVLASAQVNASTSGVTASVTAAQGDELVVLCASGIAVSAMNASATGLTFSAKLGSAGHFEAFTAIVPSGGFSGTITIATPDNFGTLFSFVLKYPAGTAEPSGPNGSNIITEVTPPWPSQFGDYFSAAPATAPYADPFHSSVNSGLAIVMVGSDCPAITGTGAWATLASLSGVGNASAAVLGAVGNQTSVTMSFQRQAPYLFVLPLEMTALDTVAAKLAFTQQPGGGTNDLEVLTNRLLPVQPVVVVQNAGGVTLSVTNTVAFSITPVSGVGALLGTVSASAVAGVRAPSDLSVLGGGVFTIGATSPGLTGATSSQFTVAIVSNDCTATP